MTDRRRPLDALDRLDAPDLWTDISRRTPAPREPRLPESRSRAQRTAVAIFALSIGVIGIATLLVTFRGSPRVTVPPSPNLQITTGATPPRGSIVFDELISPGRQSELAFTMPGVMGSTPMTDAHRLKLVAGEAAWSPDGSRVAFVLGNRGSWRYTGDGDLYEMNADGSGLRRLTHGFGVTSPTWSPDGAQLAFVRNQGSALCTINADGSGLTVIASAHHYYQLPRWSPLGDLIAYQSDVGDIDHTAIFTIRPDGTHQRRLTPANEGAGFPSWSPDGRQLAYSSADHLMLLDVSTGKTRPLTRCALPACVSDYFPSWAPSGREIAFIRQEDGGAATHLYVLDLASGHVRRLVLPGGSQGDPTWRP